MRLTVNYKIRCIQCKKWFIPSHNMRLKCDECKKAKTKKVKK